MKRRPLRDREDCLHWLQRNAWPFALCMAGIKFKPSKRDCKAKDCKFEMMQTCLLTIYYMVAIPGFSECHVCLTSDFMVSQKIIQTWHASMRKLMVKRVPHCIQLPFSIPKDGQFQGSLVGFQGDHCSRCGAIELICWLPVLCRKKDGRTGGDGRSDDKLKTEWCTLFLDIDGMEEWNQSRSWKLSKTRPRW